MTPMRNRKIDPLRTLRLSSILAAVQHWQPSEVILTDGIAVFTAEPGMPLRDLSCIICRRPVAGEPFALHHLAMPELCKAGNPHMISVTVARHMMCERGDDEQFTALIVESVPCMTG